MSQKVLTLCLCLEDPEKCDILLSQIGAGHIFGPNQRLHLMLHNRDPEQLDALTCDIQDCAYPLVTGISTFTSLEGVSLKPDAILVSLDDRPYSWSHGTEKEILLSQQPGLESLAGLVKHSLGLVPSFANLTRGSNTPIIFLGDLAHCAASLAAKELTLRAGQIVALDGQQGKSSRGQESKVQGQLSKAFRFCTALGQWWAGDQEKPEQDVILGTKYMDLRQKEDTIGYFFSGPVNLSGPLTFSTKSNVDLDPAHIIDVKAQTDAAHQIVHGLNLMGADSGSSSSCHTNLFSASL